MKVLFLADLHFGARKDSVAFQEHFDKFFNGVLLPYVKKHKIKKLIQFGDFFDNRRSTNTRTLRHAKNILIDPLKELGCEMWVLMGNHDQFFRDVTQPNSVREHLSHHENVHVIDKIETVKFGKCNIDIVPWICDENREEILDFISKSESKICCGHMEIAGFDMYRGIKNEHGYKSKFLNNYEAVFSGHYHAPSANGNIQYLGTPYQITWSDCGDKKGFHVFDTITKTTEFVQNPYQIHHKIIYSDETSLVDIKNFDYNFYKDSYIKIIVDVKHDIPHFENFIEALWKHSNPLDLNITDVTLAYRDIDIESIETQDPLTALINTIENDSENNVKLDVAVIKKIAMEIHSEALLNVYEG